MIKKVNPQASIPIQIGGKVLILNIKRKKGELHDLWQGPYPVKKENIETVIIGRENKTFSKESGM